MSEHDFYDHDPKEPEHRTLAVTVFDYIDKDGDLLSLDIVDEEFLAVSVISRGQQSVLSVVFDDTAPARRFGAKMVEWADDIDEARRDI